MLTTIVLAWALGADAADETRRLLAQVVASRRCSSASAAPTEVHCKYRVDTAALEIAGVGNPMAQLGIDGSDPQRTWVSFMMASQCLAVKNQYAVVYISPKNGKVYDDSSLCSVAHASGR